MKSLALVACVMLLSACSSQPASTPAATSAPAPAKIPVTTKSPEALTHYQKALTFFENARAAEGVEELKQALALDPEFPTARVLHGVGTPGPEGLKEMEAALTAAASLPESERLLIDAAVAQRRGDQVKAVAALTRATEVAPGDYQGFMLLGTELLGEQKYAESVQALKKATELNPSNGGSQNQLGYAALRQGDTATAIAAFEQYTRIQPQEANAQDSLGEALMGAGRFKEAEAAFQKAAEMTPQFWAAQQGIAYSRFYAGDWAGGRAALAKGREVATRAVDKLTLDDDLAVAAAAQRDFAGALKALDAMEKAPGLQPDDVAFVGVVRGLTQMEAGRAREALASLNGVVAAADGGAFTPGVASNIRPQALRVRAMIEAQAGDAAAAAKTSAALDADAMAQPNNAFVQSIMHHGRAMLALAKRDTAGALAELSQCSPEDVICSWNTVRVAEKAGDKAAATAARATALKIYRRDPLSLIVRSRLSAPAGAS